MKTFLKNNRLTNSRCSFKYQISACHSQNANNSNYKGLLGTNSYFFSKQPKSDWLNSEEKMTKHLNILNPVLNDIENEIKAENELEERLFREKRDITNLMSNKQLVYKKYLALKEEKERFEEELSTEHYISNKGTDVYTKFAPIDEAEYFDNDENLDKLSYVSFFDRSSFNSDMVTKMKHFLENIDNLKVINYYYDFQRRFSFAKLVFYDETDCLNFKFKYNFSKLNDISFFDTPDTKLHGSPVKDNMKNILVINSRNEFSKETKEDRTLVLSNLHSDMTRSEVIDLCSNFGSVIDINMPVINKVSEKIKEHTIDSSQLLREIEQQKKLFTNKKDSKNLLKLIKIKLNNIVNEYTSKSAQIIQSVLISYYLNKISTTIENMRDNQKTNEIPSIISLIFSVKYYLTELLGDSETADSIILLFLKSDKSTSNASNLEEFIQQEKEDFLKSKEIENLFKTMNVDSAKEETYKTIQKLMNNITQEELSDVEENLTKHKHFKVNKIENNKVSNTIKSYFKENPNTLLLNSDFINKQLNRLKFASSLSEYEKSALKGKYDINIEANFPIFIEYFNEFSKKNQIEIFDKYFSIARMYFELSDKEKLYVGRHLYKLSLSSRINNFESEQFENGGLIRELCKFLNIRTTRGLRTSSKIEKTQRHYYYKIANSNSFHTNKYVNAGIFLNTSYNLSSIYKRNRRLLGKIKYIDYINMVNNHNRHLKIKSIKRRMDYFNSDIDLFLLAVKNSDKKIVEKYQDQINYISIRKFVDDFDTDISKNTNEFKDLPAFLRDYYKDSRARYETAQKLDLPYPVPIDTNILSYEAVATLKVNQEFNDEIDEILIEENKMEGFENTTDNQNLLIQRNLNSLREDEPPFPFWKYSKIYSEPDENDTSYYQEIADLISKLSVKEFEDLTFNKILQIKYKNAPSKKDFNMKKNVFPPLTEKQIKDTIYHFNVRREKLMYDSRNIRYNTGLKNSIFELESKKVKDRLIKNVEKIFKNNSYLKAKKLEEIETYFGKQNISTNYDTLQEVKNEFTESVIELIQQEIEYHQTTKNLKDLIENLSDEFKIDINKSNFIQVFSLYKIAKDLDKKEERDFIKNVGKNTKKYETQKGEYLFNYIDKVKKAFKQDKAFINELQQLIEKKREQAPDTEDRKLALTLLDKINTEKINFNKDKLETYLTNIDDIETKEVEYYKLNSLMNLSKDSANFFDEIHDENKHYNIQANRQKSYLSSLIDINNISQNDINKNEKLFRNRGYALVTFAKSMEAKRFYLKAKNDYFVKSNLNQISIEPSFVFNEKNINIPEILNQLPKIEPKLLARESLEKTLSQIEEEIKKEKDNISEEEKRIANSIEDKKELIKNINSKKMFMESTVEEEDALLFSHHYLNFKNKKNTRYDEIAKGSLLDESLFESKDLIALRLNNEHKITNKVKLANIIRASLNPYVNQYHKQHDTLLEKGAKKSTIQLSSESYSTIPENIELSPVYKGRNKPFSITDSIYGTIFNQDTAYDRENLPHIKKDFLEGSRGNSIEHKYITNYEEDYQKKFPIEKYLVKPVRDFENKIDQINLNALGLIKHSKSISYSSDPNKQSLKGAEADLLSKISYDNEINRMVRKERDNVLEEDQSRLLLTIQKLYETDINSKNMEVIVNNRHMNKTLAEKYKKEYIKTGERHKYRTYKEKEKVNNDETIKRAQKYIQDELERREKMKLEILEKRFVPGKTDYDTFSLRKEQYELLKAEGRLDEYYERIKIKSSKENEEEEDLDENINPKKKNTQIDLEGIVSIKNKYKSSLESEKKISRSIENKKETSNENNNKLKIQLDEISKKRDSSFNNFVKNNLMEEMQLIPSLNEFFNKKNKNGKNNSRITESAYNKKQASNLASYNSKYNNLLLGILKLKKNSLSNEEFYKFFESGIEENQRKLDSWLSPSDIDIINKCEKDLHFDAVYQNKLKKIKLNENGIISDAWFNAIQENLITKDIISFNLINEYSDSQYYIKADKVLDHINELSKFNNIKIEIIDREGEYVLIKRENTKKYKYSLKNLLDLDFNKLYFSYEKEIIEFVNNIDNESEELVNIVHTLESFKLNPAESYQIIEGYIVKIINKLYNPYISDFNNDEVLSSYNKEFLLDNFISLVNKLKKLDDEALNSIYSSLNNLDLLFNKNTTTQEISSVSSINNLVNKVNKMMDNLNQNEIEILLKLVQYINRENLKFDPDYRKLSVKSLSSHINNLITSVVDNNENKQIISIIKYLLGVHAKSPGTKNTSIYKIKEGLLKNLVKNKLSSTFSSKETTNNYLINQYNNLISLAEYVNNNSKSNLSQQNFDRYVVELKEKLFIMFSDLKNLSKLIFIIMYLSFYSRP